MGRGVTCSMAQRHSQALYQYLMEQIAAAADIQEINAVIDPSSDRERKRRRNKRDITERMKLAIHPSKVITSRLERVPLIKQLTQMYDMAYTELWTISWDGNTLIHD